MILTTKYLVVSLCSLCDTRFISRFPATVVKCSVSQGIASQWSQRE